MSIRESAKELQEKIDILNKATNILEDHQDRACIYTKRNTLIDALNKLTIVIEGWEYELETHKKNWEAAKTLKESEIGYLIPDEIMNTLQENYVACSKNFDLL